MNRCIIRFFLVAVLGFVVGFVGKGGTPALASPPSVSSRLFRCFDWICQKRWRSAQQCYQQERAELASGDTSQTTSATNAVPSCIRTLAQCEQQCLQLAQRPMLSGFCFRSCSFFHPHLSQTESLSSQRIYRELFFANAVRLLRKAATQSTSPNHRLYLKELAAVTAREALLIPGLTAPFYRGMRSAIQQAEQDIGYTTLTILMQPQSQQATLQLRGYQSYRTQQTSLVWTLPKLRPGTYELTVILASSPPHQQQIVLPPSTVTQLLISFPQQPPSNPNPWILGGIGLGVLLAGLITTVVGYGSLVQRDHLDSTLKGYTQNTTPQQREATLRSIDLDAMNQSLQSHHNTASLAIPVGWSLLGTGTAVTLGSIVWWRLTAPRKTKDTSVPKATIHFIR